METIEKARIRCKIAPEFDCHYIEKAAEEYPAPKQVYQGRFAVDLYSPKTLDSVISILSISFSESRENVIDAATKVIETITNTI